MKTPIVSICIPTYLQTTYLKKTLLSIQEQLFQDYEIIITDDSPNDSVERLLKEFNFQGKLQYFKNKIKLGTPKNWNECVKKANGTYIKVLHHDDWFSNNESLNDFVNLMEQNPKADFGFCASKSMDKDGNILFTQVPNKKQLNKLRRNCEVLFLGNFIGAPSVTIYKKLSSMDYDNNIRWMVDVDFYIRILKKNSFFAYSKKPLISVTVDAEHQVTRDYQKNRYLELEESVYLYKKIIKHKKILHKLFFLFRVFKSQVFKNTTGTKIKNGTPFEIKLIINYDKKIKEIKKIIKKIIKK